MLFFIMGQPTKWATPEAHQVAAWALGFIPRRRRLGEEGESPRWTQSPPSIPSKSVWGWSPSWTPPGPPQTDLTPPI